MRRRSIDLLRIEAERICIIKPSALGDVVQSLPLLPVLAERFPGADLHWAINRELAPLLEDHSLLDGLIKFERYGTWASWRRTLRQLRDGRFDLVFDLQGLLRTGLMTLATRAPLRIGLQSAREGAHLTCHHTIPDSGRLVPAHRRYWRVAEALGLGDLQAETEIPMAAEDRNWAATQMARVGPRILAIHAGARWQTKRWPVEKFAVVACKAIRLYGYSVVLLGSAAEQPLARQLETLINRFVPAQHALNLTGRTSLKQLAAVLSSAEAVLTNDSGPMHMAAALGTPVLGVFTCTCPIRSGPPGPEHELVATGVRCAARYRKRCPKRGVRHLACMDELTPERVIPGLARIAERENVARRAA
ncbi:MAG: heptosyltransferase [Planctomycetaceae bacterium]|nr:heptosyltransferase [Planctomycetaceae bacterium]